VTRGIFVANGKVPRGPMKGCHVAPPTVLNRSHVTLCKMERGFKFGCAFGFFHLWFKKNGWTLVKPRLNQVTEPQICTGRGHMVPHAPNTSILEGHSCVNGATNWHILRKARGCWV
jgi:hypothetical protein